MRARGDERVIGLGHRAPAGLAGLADQLSDSRGPAVVGAHQVDQLGYAAQGSVAALTVEAERLVDAAALRQALDGRQDTRAQGSR